MIPRLYIDGKDPKLLQTYYKTYFTSQWKVLPRDCAKVERTIQIKLENMGAYPTEASLRAAKVLEAHRAVCAGSLGLVLNGHYAHVGMSSRLHRTAADCGRGDSTQVKALGAESSVSAEAVEDLTHWKGSPAAFRWALAGCLLHGRLRQIGNFHYGVHADTELRVIYPKGDEIMQYLRDWLPKLICAC